MTFKTNEYYFLVIPIVLLAINTWPVFSWPTHDTSTLVQLQIVHRHGDRTPIQFFAADPYRNASQYWRDGLGELTARGKYRLYKMGQFVRDAYAEYLGDQFSPLEVYARSSLSHRCLESVACLLAGAYPPNSTDTQWNNGSDADIGRHWQPMPIESFMPKANDTLLDVDKPCPNADTAEKQILNSERVRSFLKEREKFLTNISSFVGEDVNSLKLVNRLYSDLSIELENHYKWSDKGVWSAAYEALAFAELAPMAAFYWSVEWDNSLIERVRAGDLVGELVRNMEDRVRAESDYKLLVYSTHDTKLAALMSALNIFNGQLVPFGASLLVELHRNRSAPAVDYFVRVYYYNRTAVGDGYPYLMVLPECQNRSDCPIEVWRSVADGLAVKDWNKDCGINNGLMASAVETNLVLLILNLVLAVALTALIVYNCREARRYYSYSQLSV